tara:strand:+ start:596 stop:937 length:342 start_codon:yes stop_codon:yes gene_type:complete
MLKMILNNSHFALGHGPKALGNAIPLFISALAGVVGGMDQWTIYYSIINSWSMLSITLVVVCAVLLWVVLSAPPHPLKVGKHQATNTTRAASDKKMGNRRERGMGMSVCLDDC